MKPNNKTISQEDGTMTAERTSEHLSILQKALDTADFEWNVAEANLEKARKTGQEGLIRTALEAVRVAQEEHQIAEQNWSDASYSLRLNRNSQAESLLETRPLIKGEQLTLTSVYRDRETGFDFVMSYSSMETRSE